MTIDEMIEIADRLDALTDKEFQVLYGVIYLRAVRRSSGGFTPLAPTRKDQKVDGDTTPET